METTKQEQWEKEILAQLTAWKAAAADHGITEPKYLYLILERAQNIFNDGKQELLDKYAIALVASGINPEGVYAIAEKIWKDREDYRASNIKEVEEKEDDE